MHPQQPPLTLATGLANSSSKEQIPLCKKYIWGVCDKYEQCRFRHELDIEQMKSIVQFCHDYQNKSGCTRDSCKYLHASKEEQNIFLATGDIPRVLAERHAAMGSNAPNTQSNAETIPQIAMFISESFMQPPPAPWPPLPPQQAGLPPVASAPPPPPPTSPPRHAPALQSTQHPPPPPPHTAAQLRPAPTSYSAMSPQTSVLFSMTQPPPVVPPSFDASVPPPPIPTHLQPNNALLKRKSDMNGNAGTSKRKPEGSELSESHCENCIQRELRIDGYKQQMEALHNEEEAQILLYKKKLQEYEIGRDLLKTIVGPELFSVFDKLIEGAQTPQLENYASFNSGSSTVSKQALLQLFQMLLGGETRNHIEPVPSTSHVDEALQSLTSLTRRHNVSNFSNQGPDLMKFVMETLRNGTASDRTPSEERPVELLNRTNRFTTNGQKEAAVVSEPVRYSYPTVSAHGGVASHGVAGPSGYSAPAPYPMYHPAVPPPARPPQYYPQPPASAHGGVASYGVAGPSGYSAPAPYPMYHPAVPPPARPPQYYPQPPGAPYNATSRMNGAASREMQPPTTPAGLRPSRTNAPNDYMAAIALLPYQ